MKRRIWLALGGVLAIGVAGGYKLKLRAERLKLSPPDQDGFSWRVVDADDHETVVDVPPVGLAMAALGPDLIQSANDINGPRFEVAFSPDGKELVTSAYDIFKDKERDRLVYDVAKRTLVRREPHAAATVVDGGAPGAPLPKQVDDALVFDDGERFTVPSKIEAMTWSPDRMTLAIVLEDGELVFRRGQGLERLGGAASKLKNGVCDFSGRKLVTGGLRIVDLMTGAVTPLHTREWESYLLSRQAAWRHGGAEVAIGIEPNLYRFDATSGLILSGPHHAPAHDDWRVRAVDNDFAFAMHIPYGQTYAAFHVETGVGLIELQQVESHSEGSASITDVGISEDGRWLASDKEHDLQVRDYRDHTGWRASTRVASEDVRVSGAFADVSSRDGFERWDLEKRERTALVTKLPDGELKPPRNPVSHSGDRLLLSSGRVVSLATGKLVSEGPRGLARRYKYYSSGCWGDGDRFLVLMGYDAIVLHRMSDGKSLILRQFVVGSAVETLVTAPDGTFDGSDELLKTVWLSTRDGSPQPATNAQASRRRGLLADFHAGR